MIRCIEVFNTLNQDNKDPLICAIPVTVFVRDPLLRVRKYYGGLSMSLEQALKGLA